MAGTITFLKPIDHASGKTFGLGTKFVSTYREDTDHRGCAYQNHARNYSTNPLTAAELTRQTNFSNASAKLKVILGDSELYEAWLADFKEKKAAGTLSQKTLNGYIFAKAYKNQMTSDNKPLAA